jgi:hypothetical protein
MLFTAVIAIRIWARTQHRSQPDYLEQRAAAMSIN